MSFPDVWKYIGSAGAGVAADHVGTAALGCPTEQGSAISPTTCGGPAALDRTAGGGCPHVVFPALPVLTPIGILNPTEPRYG